jgi:hypothetical protein
VSDNPFLDILNAKPAPDVAPEGTPAPSANPFSDIIAGKIPESTAAPVNPDAGKLVTDKTVVVPGATTTIPKFLTDPSQPGEIPIEQVPGKFLSHILPNVMDVVGNLAKAGKEGYDAVTDHPGVIARQVADSLAEHAIHGPTGTQVVNNITDMLGGLLRKYGSWAKVKDELSNRPVETMLDAATFTPIGAGEGTAAKMLGPVGRAIGTGADVASQFVHGVGPGALTEMFRAGQNVTPNVWSTLTKGLDRESVLGQLDDAADALVAQRAHRYDELMSEVEGHDKVLPFDKIDDAVNSASKIRQYEVNGKKFMIEQNPAIKDMRGKIIALVQKYKDLGPEFHTAFGLDKLKQAIYSLADGVVDANGMPTSEAKFANRIAQSIGDTIKSEAPIYGKAMENWQNDTDYLKNIRKEFKAGDPEKQMQAVRSLQQVWRDTAGSAHTEKNKMLREMVNKTGNTTLMPQLAAEQYNHLFPRGLRGIELGAEAFPVLGMSLYHPELAALWAARAASSSPRLAGTLAYGVGRASSLPGVRHIPSVVRKVEKFGPNAAGLGQLESEQEPRARGGFFTTKRRGR